MIWRAVLVVFFWTSMAVANGFDLPALYDVTGVAADDVLNIRRDPDALSDIIGTLAPDTKGIEVVSLNETEGWAQVNSGEQAGWVSMAYLRVLPYAMWTNLSSPMTCYGTEPFWDVKLTPRAPSTFNFNADSYGPMVPVWESGAWGNPLRVIMRHEIPGGQITSYLEAEACNDGMSDRAFGLSLRMMIDGPEGTHLANSVLRGCCSISER